MLENPHISELRKIIHVDMDAFYASVEELDNPSLKGKPVAVGGNERRGVISAANYEARKFGVRSAMPGVVAARLCPDLIFVRPRFDRYQEISQIIRSIFFEYTDLVEPLALDEAFLDVTTNKKGMLSATLMAQEIRQRIFEETGLSASAGISINKFTAKIASDRNKPNGQLTVPPDKVETFLESLSIDLFFGVGKVTATKLKELGIRTGKDLKGKSIDFLKQHFGKQGQQYYNLVRGIQLSAVKPNRERKSLAVERTFSRDLHSKRAILEQLERISLELERRVEKRLLGGKTITLKLKFDDFKQITRSKTLEIEAKSHLDFWPAVEELVENLPELKPVRLVGLSLSKFSESTEEEGAESQLTLQF